MNIGMICRFDNSGLSSLTWETARHLRPHKVLLVENNVFQTFPERYAEFNTRRVPGSRGMTVEDINWLLDGTDVVLSAETFYNGDLIGMARHRGVKTALITMYEMSPENIQKPDLFICPSKLDYDVMPEPKVYLPTPMATDRLVWKERKEAKVFVHTASHGGMNLRKGTPKLIEAMRYVKSNIKLVIYSWMHFECDDRRVEVKVMNFKNYWQIWREGDVLIYPQDYNGICLPVMEAFTSGLGVLTTDIYPFNEYLPKRLLFEHDGLYKTRAAHGLLEVDAARINPQKIAKKIDEIAGTDISEESFMGRRWGEEQSWEKLKPQFISILEKLCTS